MSALQYGGEVEVHAHDDGCVSILAEDIDLDTTVVRLTRLEAIGLAQQLLKAANAPEAVA